MIGGTALFPYLLGIAAGAALGVGAYQNYKGSKESDIDFLMISEGHFEELDKLEKKKPQRHTEPKDLNEQLTLGEAKANPGEDIMKQRIKDPRYQEDKWTKKQYIHENPDGSKTNVHYWEEIATGEREGFKFVDE